MKDYLMELWMVKMKERMKDETQMDKELGTQMDKMLETQMDNQLKIKQKIIERIRREKISSSSLRNS